MIECHQCGSANDDRSKYCTLCGTKLTSEGVIFSGFWRRVLAYIIDFIIVFMTIVTVGTYIYGEKEPPGWIVIPIVGVNFFYNILMECSPIQATLGKKAMRIVVVDQNFQRIGFLRSLLRNISKYLSGASVIGYLLPVFIAKKQALHDLIVNTVVVRKESIIGFGSNQKRLNDRSPKLSSQSLNKALPKININSCTEEQLANLPGVGPVLAKKAIILRVERGGFGSLEEFASALGLQPHITECIRPLITIKNINMKSEPKKEGKAKKELKGRIIDI